jgi:hypothetical protein
VRQINRERKQQKKRKQKFLEKMCVRKIPNLRLWVTHGSVPVIFIFPGAPAVFAKFVASVS